MAIYKWFDDKSFDDLFLDYIKDFDTRFDFTRIDFRDLCELEHDRPWEIDVDGEREWNGISFCKYLHDYYEYDFDEYILYESMYYSDTLSNDWTMYIFHNFPIFCNVYINDIYSEENCFYCSGHNREDIEWLTDSEAMLATLSLMSCPLNHEFISLLKSYDLDGSGYHRLSDVHQMSYACAYFKFVLNHSFSKFMNIFLHRHDTFLHEGEIYSFLIRYRDYAGLSITVRPTSWISRAIYMEEKPRLGLMSQCIAKILDTSNFSYAALTELIEQKGEELNWNPYIRCFTRFLERHADRDGRTGLLPSLHLDSIVLHQANNRRHPRLRHNIESFDNCNPTLVYVPNALKEFELSLQKPYRHKCISYVSLSKFDFYFNSNFPAEYHLYYKCLETKDAIDTSPVLSTFISFIHSFSDAVFTFSLGRKYITVKVIQRKNVPRLTWDLVMMDSETDTHYFSTTKFKDGTVAFCDCKPYVPVIYRRIFEYGCNQLIPVTVNASFCEDEFGDKLAFAEGPLDDFVTKKAHSVMNEPINIIMSKLAETGIKIDCTDHILNELKETAVLCTHTFADKFTHSNYMMLQPVLDKILAMASPVAENWYNISDKAESFMTILLVTSCIIILLLAFKFLKFRTIFILLLTVFIIVLLKKALLFGSVYLLVNKILNLNNDEPQAESLLDDVVNIPIKNVANMLLLVICSATIKRLPNNNDIDKFATRLYTFPRAVNGIKEMFSQLGSLTSTIEKFIMVDIFGKENYIGDHEVDTKVLNLLEEVKKLKDLNNFSNVVVNRETADKVNSLYQECLGMMGEGAQARYSRQVFEGLKTALTTLQKLSENNFQSGMYMYSEVRSQPMVEIISGNTGIGKSTMASLIDAEFGYRMGWSDAYLRSQQYTRNITDQYWSGYHGQKLCRYDDWMQRKDNEMLQVPEPMEFIYLKSNSPLPLNMASIHEKGNTFFSSIVVSCYSNVENLENLIKSVIQSQAVVRRFDLCFKAELDERFARTRTGLSTKVVDEEKARSMIREDDLIGQELGFNRDIWRFFAVDPSTQKKSSVIPGFESHPYDHVKGMSFQEYCDFRWEVFQKITRQNESYKKTCNNYIQMKEKHQVRLQAESHIKLDDDAHFSLIEGNYDDFIEFLSKSDDGRVVLELIELSNEGVSQDIIEQRKNFSYLHNIMGDDYDDLFVSYHEMKTRQQGTILDSAWMKVTAVINMLKKKLNVFGELWEKASTFSKYLFAGISAIGLGFTLYFSLTTMFKEMIQDEVPVPSNKKEKKNNRKKVTPEMVAHVPLEYSSLIPKEVGRLVNLHGKEYPVISSKGITCEVCHKNSYFTFYDEFPRCLSCIAIREDLEKAHYIKPWNNHISRMNIINKLFIENDDYSQEYHVKANQAESPTLHKSTHIKATQSHSPPLNKSSHIKVIQSHSPPINKSTQVKATLSHEPTLTPVPLPEPSGEVAIAHSGTFLYDISLRLIQNQFKIYGSKDNVVDNTLDFGTTFAIEGVFYGINRHGWKIILKLFDKKSITELYFVGSLRQFKVAVDDIKFYESEQSFDEFGNPTYIDLTILQLPTYVAQVQSIRKNFISREELHYIPPDGLCKPYGGLSVKLDVCKGRIGGFILSANHIHRTTHTVAPCNTSETYRNIIKYTTQLVKGDCGSLLTFDHASLRHPIIGFHSGKYSSGTSYATLVTREDIDEILKEAPRMPYMAHSYFDSLNFIKYDNHTNMPEGEFIPVGIVDYKATENLKTNIVKSPIFNQLTMKDNSVYHSQYAPAVLHDYYDEETGERKCVMKEALKKCGKPFTFINPQEIKDAVSILSDFLVGHEPEEELDRFGDHGWVLPVNFAVMGVNGSKYSPGIKRKASAGYEFERTKGISSKKDLFGKEGEYDLENPGARMVLQRVQNADVRLLCGERYPTFWKDNRKDEKRPLTKVNEFKTRVFSSGDTSYQILMRRYFEVFFNAYRKSHGKAWSMVGTNVYSEDWDEMVSTATANNRKGVLDGDFTNFDGTMPVQIMDAVVDVINNWYSMHGSSDDSDFVRKTLWMEIVNSQHVYKDRIYGWKGSQPSGQPYTAETNCLALSLCFIIVLRRILGPKRSPNMFNLVKLYLYGDDSLVFFDPSVIPELTFKELFDQFATLGMEYTDGDKKNKFEVKFKRLNEVMFLKRKFVWDEEFQRWKAPLSLTSIYEMCYWIRNGPNHYEQLRQNLKAALMEISLHGKEWYDHFSLLVKRISYKNKLWIIVPTYEEQLTCALKYEAPLGMSFEDV